MATWMWSLNQNRVPQTSKYIQSTEKYNARAWYFLCFWQQKFSYEYFSADIFFCTSLMILNKTMWFVCGIFVKTI